MDKRDQGDNLCLDQEERHHPLLINNRITKELMTNEKFFHWEAHQIFHHEN
jgi:hypothetical protein